MTVSIQEINDAVRFGNFTNEQLRSIGDAITYRRSLMLKENKRELTVGRTVKFANRGRTITGEVTKVNRKYVYVREAANSFNGGIFATTWKVPGYMLTPIN